jgi:hypothetical protein
MCAIAGRVNVPTFASNIGSPEILLAAVCPRIRMRRLMVVDGACSYYNNSDAHVLRVQMGK